EAILAAALRAEGYANSRRFSPGVAGLLGACSHFSDTLLVRAMLGGPQPCVKHDVDHVLPPGVLLARQQPAIKVRLRWALIPSAWQRSDSPARRGAPAGRRRSEEHT